VPGLCRRGRGGGSRRIGEKGWCSGCNGTGSAQKCPTQWAAFPGGIQLVKDAERHLKEQAPPYAVVDADASDAADWRRRFDEIVDKHLDKGVIVVDCHA